MAFVTCSQFKTSQEEQDKKAISAEDSLLDKSSGEGGGKVTAEKIKEAIAGNVEVAVKDKSGIKGNGTKKSPLALNLGSSIKVSDEGKIEIIADKVANIRLVDASGTRVLGRIVGV
ncbi:hypothetical protein BKK47_02900 [Rodentibacter mrazii]|uniref:Uncharacterized protein n=1 Tax=Rodentibacter mrazii TaxID=1908257 RepID=A0A1V3IIR1_9PAST|nr:hypothetical protein [Rodentibacter mrazii]OOF40872.1 hypothetical protein BKK47_02900 [Rodentibacter mrazii]